MFVALRTFYRFPAWWCLLPLLLQRQFKEPRTVNGHVVIRLDARESQHDIKDVGRGHVGKRIDNSYRFVLEQL